MKLTLPFGVGLLSLVLTTSAGAQTFQVPPVEIGGEGGMVVAIGEGLHPRPTAGPRVTFNISQQNAIELAADTIFLGSRYALGLYFLQYKRTTRRPSDWSGIRPFYTAGTGGYYTYRKVPERRETRLDGSVVIYPAHSTGELSRFNVATFGGGFERGLNRHASFRLEGSGFLVMSDDGLDGFLGFRILAGVSVPIGGYRAATIK